MKKQVFWAVLILFLLPSLGSRAWGTSLKVSPSSFDLTTAGSTILIQVNIEDVTDLGGLEFKISFNPSVLQIESQSQVVEGPFLSGALVWRKDVSTPGLLKYGATITPGASGSGTLVEITFDILDPSSCTALRLYDIVLSDTNFNGIEVDSVQNGSAKRCGVVPAILMNILNP